MERSILNIKIKDKVRLTTITKETKIIHVKYKIKKLKCKWAGHLMKSKIEKWAKEVTEWCPRYNKKNRGRQYCRWEDDIKKVKNWVRKTRDRSL